MLQLFLTTDIVSLTCISALVGFCGPASGHACLLAAGLWKSIHDVVYSSCSSACFLVDEGYQPILHIVERSSLSQLIHTPEPFGHNATYTVLLVHCLLYNSESELLMRSSYMSNFCFARILFTAVSSPDSSTHSLPSFPSILACCKKKSEVATPIVQLRSTSFSESIALPLLASKIYHDLISS